MSLLRAYDARLDDSLSLARASGLVTQLNNGRQKLTDLGRTFVQRIREQEGLMEWEQEFLVSLGKINESDMWRRLGAPPKLVRSEVAT